MGWLLFVILGSFLAPLVTLVVTAALIDWMLR